MGIRNISIKATEFGGDYFKTIGSIKNAKTNTKVQNFVSGCAIFSLVIVPIPIVCGIAWGINSGLKQSAEKTDTVFKAAYPPPRKEDISNGELEIDRQTESRPSTFSNASLNPSLEIETELDEPLTESSSSSIDPFLQELHKTFLPGDKTNYLKTFQPLNSAKEEISYQEYSIEDSTTGYKYMDVTIAGSNISLTIRQQNILKSGAQVIVNAANKELKGGSGINGLLQKEGGKDYRKAHRVKLHKEFNGKHPEGLASMITSGDLIKNDPPIGAVIVIAGPKCSSKTTEADISQLQKDQLYSCYYNSLVLAHFQGVETLALPSISTGIFNFPKELAAEISLKAVYDFTRELPKSCLKTVSIHFLPEEEGVLEDYTRVIEKRV